MAWEEFDADGEPIASIDDSMLHVDRVQFERGMSSLPRATAVLVLACTAVFALEISKDALKDADKLVEVGALHGQKLAGGEYWRLLSATFLHGSPDHLIGNALMLIVLGIACEHAFGWRQFVVLYVASGLAGSLASSLEGKTSVGASGAIFGLVGGLIAFLHRRRGRLYVRDKRIGVVLLVYTLWQVGTGFLTPWIDNLAHIGGLLGGALVGWFLHPVVLESDRKQPLPVAASAAFVVALVALTYAGIFFVPKLL